MNTIAEAAVVTRMPLQVAATQTDMYGRMRLGAFANMLIEAAIQSADRLGFGYGNLKEVQLFWVLSRMTVKLYRSPKWYEKFEVETWPKGSMRILYFRDFIVRDEAGEIVAEATSGWLAVDAQSKRPKVLSGVDEPDFFDALKGRHAIAEQPVRLAGVAHGDVFQVESVYFDVDLNGHVATSRYLDWVMDSFDALFHQQNYPKGFSVNFLKETLPGEGLQLTRKLADAGVYLFEGLHRSTGNVAVRAAIEF